MITLIAILSVTLIVLGPHWLSKFLIAKREQRRDKKKNAWWNELEKEQELNRLLGNNPGVENEELLLSHPKDWEVNY